MHKSVITIARQYGSGGHEIGEQLAKEIGVPFYDKELVEMAAQKSDISKEILEKADERATNSLLYSLVTGNPIKSITSPLYYDIPVNDKLFIAQSEIIKNIAGQGPCVIVGRCADYVLEDTDVNIINVFIFADMKAKMERIQKLYDLSPEKAKDKIIKTEKKRRTYYNYYTNREWGKIENYDLCINSSNIGVSDTVEIIKMFAKSRGII